MATVMMMHWADATTDQYEEIHRRANWDGDRPAGANLHVVGWADDGMHILDVWDSPADFQAFFESRVAPVIQELGITSQPEVKIFELHGIYAPAFGHTAQTASV
jgi:heme-degrading monooxygenase HmoA